jgi:hypothetical protein
MASRSILAAQNSHPSISKAKQISHEYPLPPVDFLVQADA